ncbi:Fe(3+) ABC transporter substrate-binding protein, partial [bacterium]|nr:Fe(3+) ABC transporter substrate-binding protein [bacterium]
MADAPNPEGAAAFIQFVLSPEGQAILKRSEFVPISPALVPSWGAPPPFLAGLAEPEAK